MTPEPGAYSFHLTAIRLLNRSNTNLHTAHQKFRFIQGHFGSESGAVTLA